MTAPEPTRFSSTDLAEQRAEVFRAVEREGAVEITRPIGEPLVLARRDVLEQQRQALVVAAELIAAALDADGHAFAEQLPDRFPWLGILSREEREQFADEIVEASRTGVSAGHYDALLAGLRQWRSTAESQAGGGASGVDPSGRNTPSEGTDPRTR